jgi:hypothetical protein
MKNSKVGLAFLLLFPITQALNFFLLFVKMRLHNSVKLVSIFRKT